MKQVMGVLGVRYQSEKMRKSLAWGGGGWKIGVNNKKILKKVGEIICEKVEQVRG